MNIFLVGTGNIAHSLLPALRKAGHNICGVYSRTRKNLVSFSEKFNIVPINETAKIPAYADIYILAVADSGITTAASMIRTKNTVLHCSGSTSINILKRYFQNCGVIYPIQTFSKEITIDFSNIPLLIEYSNDKSGHYITNLAQSLSSNVREMTSEQRRCLHLSAVFACNFTNHMIAVAKMLMDSYEVDYQLLKPLIEETLRKAIATDNPINCQTGPAVREDNATMASHLEMLAGKETLKKIYNYVSESIIEFKDKNKINNELS